MKYKQSLDLFTFNEVEVTYNEKGLGPQIKSSRDAFEFLVDGWTNIDYCEKMYIILLNQRKRIKGVAKISEGSLSGTVADPKKIFQIALKANAGCIIISHNHPSGSPHPSEQDNHLTKKCVEAGRIIELPVVDHIIITKDSYFSFSDEGLI
jgi:DNA repair protein RadC